MNLRTLVDRRALPLVLVLVAIAAMFAWVALRSGPMAPVPVVVASVEDHAVGRALFGIGTIEARYTHRIGPTAPGRLDVILVDVGDPVVPGQPLARILPIDLDDRLAAAADAERRAAAQARGAEAQTAELAARLRLANAQLRRAEELAAGGWITGTLLDQRRQEAASAQAALMAGRSNAAAAAAERDRASAEQAALTATRDNLLLRAPSAGIVVRRMAEAGTTVVAGQTVLEVVDPAQLWVTARFDQAQAGGLAVGLAAQLRLRSHPETPVAGTVVRVEPVADAVTEEMIARIRPTAPQAAPIGELVEVTVARPAARRGPAVPNAALVRVDGEVGVWLVVDGDIQFRPVVTGDQGLDGLTVVRSGLTRGDHIVVHSARPLSARSRITLVDRLP